jgi:hypothetical protein
MLHPSEEIKRRKEKTEKRRANLLSPFSFLLFVS